MMHTINNIINRTLCYTIPLALAAVFALIVNASLTQDGIVIGHPKVVHVYVNGPQDARLSQLAAAINMRQLRSAK